MVTTNRNGQRAQTRPGGRSAVVVAAARTATLDLLAEVGYDGFELTDVARRAGVNKTTVYRRWPSKSELVAEAVLSITDHQLPERDNGTLHADLIDLLTDLDALLQQSAIRAALRLAAAGTNDDPFAAVRTAFWQERFRRTAIIVERGIARGEVPVNTDPRLLLEHASSSIYFRALVTHDPITAADIDMFARRAIDEANRAAR